MPCRRNQHVFDELYLEQRCWRALWLELNNKPRVSEMLHYVLSACLFVKVERFRLKQTNGTTERVKERARSGTGPAAQQNEHLPLLISEIGANDEVREWWQREWNWIVYKRPRKPDICFGRSVCSMRVQSSRCLRQKSGPLWGFSPSLRMLAQVETTAVPPPSSFELCFGGQIMELRFKGAARCIPFFCDLHQPLFVFTTTTPRTQTSTISSPSQSGERLNLDQNEKFICTQPLMAALIW